MNLSWNGSNEVKGVHIGADGLGLLPSMGMVSCFGRNYGGA